MFCVRWCDEDFDILGPTGKAHQCFVFAPAACNLEEMLGRIGDREFDFGKVVLRCVLSALDFLHTDTKVIHTDVKPDNIMLSFKDDNALDEFARALKDRPPPQRRSADSGRIVYRTAQIKNLGKDSWDDPLLADLG